MSAALEWKTWNWLDRQWLPFSDPREWTCFKKNTADSPAVSMSWPLCSLCQQVFFPIVCVFFFLHLAVIYSWCVRSRWGAELWISATLLLLLRFCFSGLFMLTTELIQLKFYISILLGAQKRKYSFSFKVAIRSVCFGEQKISQGEYLVCCIWKVWCTFVCSPSESLFESFLVFNILVSLLYHFSWFQISQTGWRVSDHSFQVLITWLMWCEKTRSIAVLWNTLVSV